jgi:hydroxymethylbilane synthase
MTAKLRVGTRGSDLALLQTRQIISAIRERHPEVDFEIVEITTHGDRFQQTPIARMEEHIDRGIFNTGLEQAILNGEVDLATCSFKDVESELPAGLCAVSVGRREDARDVLVTRHDVPLKDLPEGAQLATSSPRRTSQLRAFRPDLRFAPLRGNIPTRVGPAAENFDGVIVAAAALIRMGMEEKIADWIDTGILLPAAAQAARGCQYHAERADVAELVGSIQDEATELCVRAEKRLLITLSGGCFAPIGVLARTAEGRFTIECRIVSLDGREKAEDRVEGTTGEAEALVAELAARLTTQGGREIISKTRAELQPS